jgi:hypothetical protein
MYEFNPTTMYYTLCPKSFIKEKLYYLLYYSFAHVPETPYEKTMTQLFTTKALNQLAVSEIFERKFEGPFKEFVFEVCRELKIDPKLAMDNLLNYHYEHAGKMRKKSKTKKQMKNKKIKKTKTTRK